MQVELTVRSRLALQQFHGRELRLVIGFLPGVVTRSDRPVSGYRGDYPPGGS